MTILVVDDEPDILLVLEDKLKELGHEQIICCESIESALSVIETVSDLTRIYLDYHMPGIKGADGILQVSKATERLTPKPKIFSISGDTRREIREQSIANGARIFLDKRQLIEEDTVLRNSYFLEERRGRDNQLNERIEKIESLVWEINTNLSHLKGQQSQDEKTIAEIKELVISNTNKLQPIDDVMWFIKKIPGGLGTSLIVLFLMIAFTSSLFKSFGLPEKFLDNFYQNIPERPVKKS